ncbi:MAG: DUF4349 domain-containing protein [Oscillospiraceae bacterium]|nr:DUF4349 domain-containing protein [Oscillospiraceae bacterium]
MKKRTLSIVLLVCIIFSCLFAGCGMGSAATDSMAPAAPSSPSASAPMDNGSYENSYVSGSSSSAGMGEIIWGDKSSPAGDAKEDVAAEEQESFGEKIIYTARVNVETTDFGKSISALDALLEQYDGFMESSETSGYASYQDDGSAVLRNRWGTFTVRVPAAQYKDFLASVSETDALGYVTNKSQDSQNVTAQYTDYEIRLETLNTQYETLLELLDKSETIDDVIALEARISEVTYEIESIESSLRNLDRKVSYSTVTISLQEVSGYIKSPSVTDSFADRVKNALANMKVNFGRSLQRFVINFIYAIPTLIILAIIIAVIIVVLVLLIKRRRRRIAEGLAGCRKRKARRSRRVRDDMSTPEITPENKDE